MSDHGGAFVHGGCHRGVYRQTAYVLSVFAALFGWLRGRAFETTVRVSFVGRVRTMGRVSSSRVLSVFCRPCPVVSFYRLSRVPLGHAQGHLRARARALSRLTARSIDQLNLRKSPPL